MVVFHSGLKPSPLFPRPPVIEKEMRAVLMRRIHTVAGPMIMRNDLGERNPMLIHQVGRELGRPINRPTQTVPLVLSHLEPDRIFVSRPIEVGMPPRYIRGQMLHRDTLIDSVVP